MTTRRRCLICRKVKPIEQFPSKHEFVCTAEHPETYKEDTRNA